MKIATVIGPWPGPSGAIRCTETTDTGPTVARADTPGDSVGTRTEVVGLPGFAVERALFVVGAVDGEVTGDEDEEECRATPVHPAMSPNDITEHAKAIFRCRGLVIELTTDSECHNERVSWRRDEHDVNSLRGSSGE